MMENDRRIAFYTRGLKYKTVDGIYRLTPAQSRRAQQKYSRWLRAHASEYPGHAAVVKEGK
jgi:hypothetical protein